MTMSHPRKITRRTTLATGLTAAAGMLVGGSARAQAKDVKVALIVPLSGPWARQGELEQKGAQMAIDEINAAGGIKALGGAKMQLVVADAGDSAEKAKNAAQRLVAQEPDLVGGVGAWLSSFTLAVTEVTERAEIPWFTLSYADSITNRGFKYVFQTSMTGDEQAISALPTVLEMAKAATGKTPKTIGMISDNTASPQSFAKPMRDAAALEKLGVRLVMDEIYTPPLSDATPLIQKVRSSRPEILFALSTNVPDDKLLVEKLNEFGLGNGKVPVIANGAHFGAPELLKVAGKEMLDGVMVTLANWSGKDQGDMVKRFKDKTGEPWMGQDSVCPYGEYWIIKEALEKAGVADRRKVAEAVRAMSLNDGPANAFPGKPLKFDEKGRRVGAKLVIVQWQNGEPVWVYPPENATAKPIWPKV
jgi:branched-chain amino acid transport system substrate-binding protein